MRNECGSRFAAFAIWQLGIPSPSLPLKAELATLADAAQTSTSHLSPATEQALDDYITELVLWMQKIAASVGKHKQSNRYQCEVRNAGRAKAVSTLDATELDIRNEVRRLQKLKAKCKHLAEQWSPSTGYDAYSPQNAQDLAYYWHGELDQDLHKLQARRTHRGSLPDSTRFFRANG